jgi:hypothetical protein
MKIKTLFLGALTALLFVSFAQAQDEQAGFIILLKNGSAVRGRTLTRDEASGRLRVSMTETKSGEPKSYAVIAMDDAESIRASSTETESIRIKLAGGSELKCKEFTLNGDTVTVKLGTASRIEVRWEDIASISFNG